MKMKAIAGAILSMVLMLTVVVGCASQDGAKETEPSAQANQTAQPETGSGAKQAEPGSGAR